MTKQTIADLVPDSRNANKGSQRGTGLIEKSLRNYGAGRSILIDADNNVIAGNKTLEGAAAIGLENLRIIETDGTEIIAVKRTDLHIGDKKTRELAIADNRTNQVSLEWDAEVLEELQGEGVDLSQFWFPDELDALLASVNEPEGLLPDAEHEAIQVYGNEQIIDAAFSYFRRVGFPYRFLPVHVCMQEINKLGQTDASTLVNSNTAYHVADTYHPHRFHVSAEKMKSPLQAYHDDKLFRRALTLQIEQNGTIPDTYFGKLDIVSGTQACSNFRPGFACKLYKDYCHAGDTVLDTSTGFGGRLVGFMASGVAGKYIGIDPNKLTHDANQKMAIDLGFAGKVELYNLPAEDVETEQFKERCDFAFTSPPYFAKEHYSEDDTQSWVRYKTGEEWKCGFLFPMMALQFASLKRGKFAIVNIADVKLRGKTFPLVDWTKEAAQNAGFDYVRTDEFSLTQRFGAGQDDEIAKEPVLVFVKN
jgi:hypothetical protein